ncbi:MAG: hypothetical protein WBP16_13850 [Ferruginibacter sp.]
MKIYIILLMLGMGNAALAQEPVAAEIVKLKIKKITRQNQENNTVTGRTVWFYNEKGDDTAMYAYGKRIYYKLITYDAKQRMQTIEKFSDDGKKTETIKYSYKPDGSYTIENTDTQYGMKNTDIFDTKGLQLSRTIPDGSVYHYIYNNKKQLIKMYSEPKNGGLEFTNEYTYNSAGKLISKINKGEYASTSVYEY